MAEMASDYSYGGLSRLFRRQTRRRVSDEREKDLFRLKGLLSKRHMFDQKETSYSSLFWPFKLDVRFNNVSIHLAPDTQVLMYRCRVRAGHSYRKLTIGDDLDMTSHSSHRPSHR